MASGNLGIKALSTNRGVVRKNLTIANGAAVSNSFAIEDLAFSELAVQTPAVWTAADIGIEVSLDNVTFFPLRNTDGARMKITGVKAAEADVYRFGASSIVVGSWKYARLGSLNTSTEAAVNQGAARALVVHLL